MTDNFIHKVPVQKLSGYQFSFLLYAYKLGLFVTDILFHSRFSESAVQFLEKEKYLERIPIEHTRYTILYLTAKGVETVKEQFMEALTMGYIHHIHPILVPGDKIRVIETLKNCPLRSITYVRSPQEDLPKGMYTLRQVDKYSILVTNDETNSLYRVKSYAARMAVKLFVTPGRPTEQELIKRCGTVDIKYISKELGKKVKDNFELVKLMSKLYELPAIQGRLTGTK